MAGSGKDRLGGWLLDRLSEYLVDRQIGAESTDTDHILNLSYYSLNLYSARNV